MRPSAARDKKIIDCAYSVGLGNYRVLNSLRELAAGSGQVIVKQHAYIAQ